VDDKIQSEQGPLYKELLFTKSQIEQRISEMAKEIIDKYDHTNTIFVSLLNGAQPFTSMLMYAIAELDPYFQPNVQSMIVSRYGPNREPGPLRLVTDLPPDYRSLKGFKVILLDDLIDEGDTLEYAKEHLMGYGAESVDNVVLVRKIKDPTVQGGIALWGFEAPDVWLTGMGMDDERLGKEGNRWGSWIAIANTN